MGGMTQTIGKGVRVVLNGDLYLPTNRYNPKQHCISTKESQGVDCSREHGTISTDR